MYNYETIKVIITKRERMRGVFMIKVGIVGATGYAGAELIRLLLQRDDVKIVGFGSKSFAGESYSKVFRSMYKYADDICENDNISELSKKADIIFTATPQGFLAENINDEVLANAKVIDLSADFRIKDVDVYEKWYKLEHKSKDLIKEAVYGLPELYREDIKKARLIANPGCYPTCSILSLQPLLKHKLIDKSSIIIDAKSGTSGAGRSAKVDNLFCEVNENMKAYGIGSHRHTPEIEAQLSKAAGEDIVISFTPHLVPMMRGILVTAYAALKSGVSEEDVKNAYESEYANEKFIRLLRKNENAETRFVKGSNFVDIGYVLDKRTNRIVVTGAIDNLIKGAAGQAIQNMNLMFGIDEECGLKSLPMSI